MRCSLSVPALWLYFIFFCHASHFKANQTLFHRNFGTPDGSATTFQASQLFNLGIAESWGGCSSDKLDTISNWVVEIHYLHYAFTLAYSSYLENEAYQILFTTYFGIIFNKDGTIRDTDSQQIWATIGERIAYVSQFLSGGGLNGANIETAPAIFCSGAYGRYADWGEAVIDSQGQAALSYDATFSNYVYTPLFQVFPLQLAENEAPIYVYALSGYDFDNRNYGDICSKPGRQAATTGSPAIPQGNINVFPISKHMVLCDGAFANNAITHSVPTLLQLISYDAYPVHDEDTTLDRLMPQSTTLYHELYHLTGNPSPDTYYGLIDALKASLGDGETRKLLATNPESYAFFALAAFMYLNPPVAPAGQPEKGAILFVEGFPMLALDILAGRV